MPRRMVMEMRIRPLRIPSLCQRLRNTLLDRCKSAVKSAASVDRGAYSVLLIRPVCLTRGHRNALSNLPPKRDYSHEAEPIIDLRFRDHSCLG